MIRYKGRFNMNILAFLRILWLQRDWSLTQVFLKDLVLIFNLKVSDNLKFYHLRIALHFRKTAKVVDDANWNGKKWYSF